MKFIFFNCPHNKTALVKMSKRSVLAIGHGSPTKVAEDFLSEILLSDNKLHF